MEEQIKQCEQVLVFIINTTAYQSHSSSGQVMGISVPKDEVKALISLSNIIGRMHVYEAQEDKENFDYMIKFFENKCEQYNIDMDEFEEWKIAQADMCSKDENGGENSGDNCIACDNGE